MVGEPIEYELHTLSRDKELGDFQYWGNGNNLSYDEDSELAALSAKDASECWFSNASE